MGFGKSGADLVTMSICNFFQFQFQLDGILFGFSCNFNFGNFIVLRFRADRILIPHLRQALTLYANLPKHPTNIDTSKQ